MRLRPFFSFYGSKFRLAPKYPAPRFDTIIEPFAGSAQYSLLHSHLNVILGEIDPVIFSVWDYLIRVKEAEILALPDIKTTVDDYKLNQEQKWLIGFNLNKASTHPCMKPSKWLRVYGGNQFWGEGRRQMIAQQLAHIRHWEVKNVSFEEQENREATWFVDPPYSDKGNLYAFSSKRLNFKFLGDWCKSRKGQVMVCENQGAEWLPFRPFADLSNTKKTVTKEVIWTN